RPVEHLVGYEILCSSVVETRRIQSDSCHPSLDQQFRSLLRDTREVKVSRVARHVRTQVLLLVRPELPPTGPDERNAFRRDLPMHLLPVGQIFYAQPIVRVSV